MAEIFVQLGTDQSILYQLVIIIVMFAISKFIFIKHMQAVIETREERTSKLEGNTEKQFEEIEKIQKAYKEKIQLANKEVKRQLDAGKDELSRKYEGEYRAEESVVNEFIKKSKKEIEAEISEKRTVVLSDAEELAKSLVNKIAKG